MTLSVKQQLSYWGIAFAALIFALWLLSSALVPFIAGAALAYFLDPIADRLERAGLSRTWSTIVITLVALFVIFLLLIIGIPYLVEQIRHMVELAPGWVEAVRLKLELWFPERMNDNSNLWESIGSLQGTVSARAGELLSSVLSSSVSVVNFLFILVVAPVVAFYLLLDWDHIIARIDTWLPRDHAASIRRLAGEINVVLSGFVRGQLTVCAILALFYGIGLAVLGLQFGLVVGLFAGMISFIPFVGSILGGLIALLMALFQFWGQPGMIVAVAVVFLVGQMVEGNFLTPKLVGRSVGLHPVWLMFALAAFGSLLGFVGLLIAVPVAASIGVLGRFILEKYLEGRLYRGTPQPKATDAE